MSLLHKIRDAAVSADTPVPTILRQIKVLAYQLDNQQLADWVEHELNGYPSAKDLPPYRKQPCEVKGDFVGIAWKAEGLPLSRRGVPEGEVRDFLFTAELTDGVAEYDHLIEQAKAGQGDLAMMWPQDMLAIVGDKFYTNMHCIRAWKVISPGTLAGLLDAVRNRALTLVLELEKAFPEAAKDVAVTAKVEAKPTVQNIVNQTFFGGQHTVAGADQKVGSVTQMQVTVGSVESLIEALRELGLPAGELEDLATAVRADEAVGNLSEPGPETDRWLGRLARRVGSGALTLAGSVTAETVTGLVLQHFGLK